MDREQAHETINQLVETYHDEPRARERLTQFTASNERPREPGQFPNLAAFLTFHEERRRYDDTLQSLRTEVATLEKAREEVEDNVRRILPANVPLYCHYEGERQDLAGTRFLIVNQHFGGGQRAIIISSSRPPSQ